MTNNRRMAATFESRNVRIKQHKQTKAPHRQRNSEPQASVRCDVAREDIRAFFGRRFNESDSDERSFCCCFLTGSSEKVICMQLVYQFAVFVSPIRLSVSLGERKRKRSAAYQAAPSRAQCVGRPLDAIIARNSFALIEMRRKRAPCSYLRSKNAVGRLQTLRSSGRALNENTKLPVPTPSLCNALNLGAERSTKRTQQGTECVGLFRGEQRPRRDKRKCFHCERCWFRCRCGAREERRIGRRRDERQTRFLFARLPNALFVLPIIIGCRRKRTDEQRSACMCSAHFSSFPRTLCRDVVVLFVEYSKRILGIESNETERRVCGTNIELQQMETRMTNLVGGRISGRILEFLK